MEQLLTGLLGTFTRTDRLACEPSGAGHDGALRLIVAVGLVAAGFGALDMTARSYPAPVAIAYDANMEGR